MGQQWPGHAASRPYEEGFGWEGGQSRDGKWPQRYHGERWGRGQHSSNAAPLTRWLLHEGGDRPRPKEGRVQMSQNNLGVSGIANAEGVKMKKGPKRLVCPERW